MNHVVVFLVFSFFLVFSSIFSDLCGLGAVPGRSRGVPRSLSEVAPKSAPKSAGSGPEELRFFEERSQGLVRHVEVS